MSQTADTRTRIITTGARQVHSRGFNATGIQAILSEASVPKGSFYFYFKCKDEFGAELIDYFSDFISGIFDRYLGNTSISPLLRLNALFDFYISFFIDNRCTKGCPIGNLSLELSDAHDLFRNHLNAAIERLIGQLARCLEEARACGEISSEIDPYDTASFIFQGFEGALLHMKVVKTVAPLESFKRYLNRYLLASSAGKDQPKWSVPWVK